MLIHGLSKLHLLNSNGFTDSLAAEWEFAPRPFETVSNAFNL